jgi:hypothetical protein
MDVMQKRHCKKIFGVLLGFALSSCAAPLLRAADLVLPSVGVPQADAAAAMLRTPETRQGLFKIGAFDVLPRISGSATYDDNIRIRSINKQKDVVFSIAPGIAAVAGEQIEGEGKSVTIDYSPSFVFFIDHNELNTIDHAGHLNAVWGMAKLTLGLSQGFSLSSGTLVDAGNRIEQRVYTTALTSKYQIGEKTAVHVNAGQIFSDYDQVTNAPTRLSGYRTWSNDDWFDYQLTGKITTGIGATLGYTDVDRNPNQTFEQALFRAAYLFTDKVDFSASVGCEWRQYHGGAPDAFAPVFNVGGTYRPFEGTAISLEGHRRNQNSVILVDQNFISTGATVSLRQRMFERLTLSASGSYDNADYQAATTTTVATRSDDYYSVRVGMDVAIRERWTAGVFYQYRKDTSNDPSFNFNNNQVGFQTSWGF